MNFLNVEETYVPFKEIDKFEARIEAREKEEAEHRVLMDYRDIVKELAELGENDVAQKTYVAENTRALILRRGQKLKYAPRYVQIDVADSKDPSIEHDE